MYLNRLQVGDHRLSWLMWKEIGNTFSWITNIEIEDTGTATRLQEVGRLRWKIENEGFNTQKNLGHGLEHKYSRIDFSATKNYYQCMHIAHLIKTACPAEQSREGLVDGQNKHYKIDGKDKEHIGPHKYIY